MVFLSSFIIRASRLLFFEQIIQRLARQSTPVIHYATSVFREHKILTEIGLFFLSYQLGYRLPALFRYRTVVKDTIKTAPQISAAEKAFILSSNLQVSGYFPFTGMTALHNVQ
jgi:hypothetical protein